MSSAITRDGVEAAAWKAGVRDPRKMKELMRVIDIYAYTLNRPELPDIIFPEVHDTSAARASVYLCRSCDTRLPIEMFPEARKAFPTHPYDCTECGGTDRKTYTCPECDQQKVLAEFPEVKQQNPRARSLCSWCEKRTVTVRDADRKRNRR